MAFSTMQSLPNQYKAIIIGSTGGIGAAFATHLSQDKRCAELIKLSRSTQPAIDFAHESSIEAVANELRDKGPFHLIIDASGLLHNDTIQPEKALKDLSPEGFAQSFMVNAAGPAFLLKHFHELMSRDEKSIFASLSAKVGSISDNQLGGWYAYRASKAALNMLIKSASIEIARKWKQALIVGLHPGTVDTELSKPFRSSISHEVFTPEYATEQLLCALDALNAQDSGKLVAYNGDILPW